MTLNEIGSSRDHWKRSKEIRSWRETFAWLGKAEKQKIQPPVRVIARLLVKSRKPDITSCTYAVKGSIDGLVDAGVLPDDSPKYVHEVIFKAPEKVGYDGLVIELEEVVVQ